MFNPFIRTLSLLLISAAVLAGAEDRLAGPIDPSRMFVLKGNIHPRAQARSDQGPVYLAMPVSYATLHLKPAPGLEEFLADQQNPRSANYHRWPTPEQFGDRFGLSANDLTRITDWLRQKAFRFTM